MMTIQQLYTKYMVKYNTIINDNRLFTHVEAYTACNIDEKTFKRLRETKFCKIKMVDAIQLIKFLDLIDINKG